MPVHPMLIGGELVQAEGHCTSPVINPSLGKEFDRVPEASINDVNKAVAAAKDAFKSWKNKPFVERAACFEKLAELIEADKDKLAKALQQEQGKPLQHALREFMGPIRQARQACQPDNELKPEEFGRNDQGRCVCVFEPRGVVAGICPWNYPIFLGCHKMIAPTIAGNTVVIKPSPYTPLSTVMLSGIVAQAFPPGVINIITGGNDVGEALVAHPDVTTITFTGSSATGKRVMAAASSKLKKVLLELGGNDPAIILPETDIKTVAPQIFEKAMVNCGQVCMAIKRVYVHASQYDEMVRELAEQAQKKQKVMGNGLSEGVEYGPLNNKMQRDRVEDLVNDARAQGARVVIGGVRANPVDAPDAYFYAHTIVSDVNDSARLVCEEQFGPVLPVLKYEDIDEAVSRANDTQYGLGASVWSSDVEQAAAVASKLQSGRIWINGHMGTAALGIDAPFGGVKESGIGKDYGGKLQYKVFCDEKYIDIPKAIKVQ